MAYDLPSRIDPWNGDSNTGTTYYGYAPAGTQDYEPKWSIRKKSVIGGVLYNQYPTGSGETYNTQFTTILLSGLRWDWRTGYTYK